jgi:colanic acid/amylovoran biosynthesis glycosyltransferase
MRVAFYVWEFPLVSETFVLNMARTVLDADHELDIRTLQAAPKGDGARHPIVSQYGLLERRRVDALSPSIVTRVLAAPAAFLRFSRRAGLRAALSITPPFAWSRDALSLRLLLMAAALDGARYDVIHCQFASLADKIARLRKAGALTGGLVVHVRGADVSRRGVRRGDYSWMFHEADAVIANSAHFRKMAIKAGCPPEKIVVIPSAINLDSFPFRAPEIPRDRRVRLLSVGRLVEKKGFRFAIDAVARLVAEGCDVGLDIIGEGPLRAELISRIAWHGLEDRVRLLGARASDAVQAALHHADIFIAASVVASDGDQDAATNTVKEAMATGVPVVATRHGGMPEMIIDGETGMLAEQGDAASLAAAVKALIAASARWDALARAARGKVAAEAASTVVDKHLLQVYDLARSQEVVAASQ